MAKIAIFELEPWEERYIREKLPKHTIYSSRKNIKPKDEKNLASCEMLIVFVYSQVTAGLIAKMPKLKAICTMSTGYDHIDLSACAKRGIKVYNVPSYGENTVAEQAFALILAISRKIVESVNRTRHGDWSLDGLRGFDLKGKTIGIVGAGKIGQHVIRMAKGFEMEVIASGGAHPDQKLARSLRFRYVPFETLLSSSDIITFHVPYNPGTHHMLNKKNINKVKKGCIIINTARGQIIETAALLAGLESGRVAYAGLDVLEEECFVKEHKALLSEDFSNQCDIKTLLQDHVLIEHCNVIVTPHNAFNTTEALYRILETTVANVNGHLTRKPINTVKGDARK